MRTRKGWERNDSCSNKLFTMQPHPLTEQKKMISLLVVVSCRKGCKIKCLSFIKVKKQKTLKFQIILGLLLNKIISILLFVYGTVFYFIKQNVLFLNVFL